MSKIRGHRGAALGRVVNSVADQRQHVLVCERVEDDPAVKAMTEESKARLPPGSPCTNCGKCCTNASYMQTLSATGDDVKRWRREGRDDILRFVSVLGPPDDPWADLWVDSENDHPERPRCPFVRKVRNQPRYLCTIYETRPQVCRDYEPWAPGSICEVV